MKVKGLIVFLMVTIVLSSCSNVKKTNSVKAINVSVLMVNGTDEATTKTYVGTVEESYGSQLSFATMGTVSQVFADEGKFVNKGDVLAVLDKQTLHNTYDIAKSTLTQTQDAYRRMNLLYKKGSLPEIKFIEIQTQLAQAQSAERIARKNLGDCVLRAPFGGYISERSVDMGNNVLPGQSCFKLVKLDKIKVKVSIPEKEIADIHVGQSVQFNVAALNNRMFTANVKEKGVQANPLSHTYDIKLEIANSDRALLPGMVCNVSIHHSGNDNSIVVPQDAVLVDGEGTYVWIVDGNRSKRRNVTSGDVSNQGIIITMGLNVGDKVIVSGQNNVSEDSKIKIQ
ncbi:efflux RND transporter periplasmic adaptor subunit [Prevotella herbatica]|nr:efflux RND transporter periplasmic adaptor subunit [Prevotella herbatica]